MRRALERAGSRRICGGGGGWCEGEREEKRKGRGLTLALLDLVVRERAIEKGMRDGIEGA